ncbi:MAG: hypothetical protein K0M49_20375 [Arenimonas sp.]|nr:hypothetical protein [Arenimonas sp.]
MKGMSKAGSKIQQVKREAAEGRGVIGYASDGTPIMKPPFKPKSFTVRELNQVIREIHREEAMKRAG